MDHCQFRVKIWGCDVPHVSMAWRARTDSASTSFSGSRVIANAVLRLVGALKASSRRLVGSSDVFSSSPSRRMKKPRGRRVCDTGVQF